MYDLISIFILLVINRFFRFIKEAETNITSRMGHVKESTSHPGSAYKIIKRFSTTWGNELKSQEQRTKRGTCKHHENI